MDAVHEVLRTIRTEQPPASPGVLMAAVGLAVLLAWVPASWTLSRHVVTLVHEGAHGLAAGLSGRRLAGIRLHSDASGVTLSKGRPTGVGMIATGAAGYLGPAALGLACALLLATGHAVAVLWLLLVLLGLLLLQIRNFFGLWSVLAASGVLFLVSWRLSEQLQVFVAHVVTWFLLVSAPKAVWELQQVRRQLRDKRSDADQLARVTHLPAVLWVGLFFVASIVAILLAVELLLS